jgi:hypothetical protein
MLARSVMELPIAIIVTGAGATAFVDAWSWLRRRLLGVPAPDWGLVGRWFAHMRHGRFRHEAIAAAAPVRGELALGWIAHYGIGIAYAALLPLLGGDDWFRRPTPGPALLLGLLTVAAPLLLMQPGMGAGLAGRRTRNPTATRLHSVLTHAIFGAGLYATAALLHSLN